MRMLYFVRERYPTHRVDVEELFAREIVRRGHRIDLVMQAASGAEPVGRADWHGCAVFVGPTDDGDGALARLHRQWLGLRHDWRTLRRVRTGDYDAIQVRDKYLLAALALRVARRRGLPFYFWMSFPEAEAQFLRVKEGTARYAPLTWIRATAFWWLLYRYVMPRARHVFVQSDQMKRDVVRNGIPADRLTAVPMGIPAADLLKFDAIRARRGSAPEPQDRPFTVVYLGTLVARRQLVILVDMLAELRRRGLDCRLLCVGDGERPADRARLLERAASLGVADRLEITGFMPRDQALLRTLEADVAVSPFFPTPVLNSTSPTKLVEYLALGIPVVANDHPEQRLVLRSSRAGVLVPWGARHFARAIDWLSALGSTRRREMGERGRHWVTEHRTYQRIADGVEARYRETLPSPGPDRFKAAGHPPSRG
jgi:glycosyltransferase involved in cell wall biosynthesis